MFPLTGVLLLQVWVQPRDLHLTGQKGLATRERRAQRTGEGGGGRQSSPYLPAARTSQRERGPSPSAAAVPGCRPRSCGGPSWTVWPAPPSPAPASRGIYFWPCRDSPATGAAASWLLKGTRNSSSGTHHWLPGATWGPEIRRGTRALGEALNSHAPGLNSFVSLRGCTHGFLYWLWISSRTTGLKRLKEVPLVTYSFQSQDGEHWFPHADPRPGLPCPQLAHPVLLLPKDCYEWVGREENDKIGQNGSSVNLGSSTILSQVPVFPYPWPREPLLSLCSYSPFNHAPWFSTLHS